jgi:hypothetical protein
MQQFESSNIIYKDFYGYHIFMKGVETIMKDLLHLR